MKTMKISTRLAVLAAALTAAFGSVRCVSAETPSLKAGDPAPEFTAVDSDGKEYRLSQYRGKYLVLEWFNEGCPFVQKHYGSGNMQARQKEAAAKGAVWLSVISSAPGKQGYSIPADANTMRKKWNIASNATILDPEGKLGRLYGAKTTPHVFVVGPEGKILYMGAIDDQPTTDPESLKNAKNYVKAALDEAMAGKPVTTPATDPYGCSVKY